MSAMRYRFGWKDRLHGARDFEAALQQGRRLEAAGVVLWIYSRPNRSEARLGLMVSRRLGGSVERNRVKRRLREIFRLQRHRLTAPIDVVIKPRAAAKELSYKELEQQVLDLWRKARLLDR